MKALPTLTLLLTQLYLLSLLVSSKVPKKYRDPEDKSLYCHVCETVLIDLEEIVMKQAADLSGTVSGYKLDSKGNRAKRSFVYDFDEEDIDNALDGVCSSWGSNLGTSKKPDGSVEMLKSGALSGSFTGSLNFGGDAGSKVMEMCKGIVKKQRQNIITTVANNDYDELRSFCKSTLSKKCKKVRFPKEISKQIKELVVRKEEVVNEEDEEAVELMEDDDDDENDGKKEL